MKPNPAVQTRSTRPRLVGVISSLEGLVGATRLRRLPDLFELRLDALYHSLGKMELHLPRLCVPLILTARDPAEGGHNHLPLAVRCTLIERFLDRAAFVDLELGIVTQLRSLLARVRKRGIGLIVSVHRLDRPVTPEELHLLLRSAARVRPNILKLVVRTENATELEQLVQLFIRRPRTDFAVAVMGVGPFGLRSRLVLEHVGSVLTYAAVGEPILDGQPSLSQLRRARATYIKRENNARIR